MKKLETDNNLTHRAPRSSKLAARELGRAFRLDWATFSWPENRERASRAGQFYNSPEGRAMRPLQRGGGDLIWGKQSFNRGREVGRLRVCNGKPFSCH